MIKTKKQSIIVIGAFILTLLLGTTTYAFFNYTRTGSSNVIKTGRIAFDTSQNTINIDNMFPIDKANLNNETDYVGTATIHITGDTTYNDGIEYLVSVTDLDNIVVDGYSPKRLPISVDVSYSASNDKTIGESDKLYFDHRGGNNSLYKVLSGDVIYDNASLAVGYIAKGETGIDGTITIKAFIDKDNIAISDTYPSSSLKYWYNDKVSTEEKNNCVTYMTEHYSNSLKNGETIEGFCNGTGNLNYSKIDNWANYNYFNSADITFLETNHIIIKYQNGTEYNWVNKRVVLSTDEWNNLHGNGISFKVKVEANEGTWVKEQGNAMKNLSYDERVAPSKILDEVDEIIFDKMNETEMMNRYNAAEYKDNITYNGEGEVLSWLEENETDNSKYTMYIASTGKIDFPEDSTYLIYNLGANYASKIEFNNSVSTSKVIDMSNLFYSTRVKRVDISSFDTNNVTNMYALFYANSELEYVNMSGLDMRKVLRMQSMFAGANKLTEVDLLGAQTRDVTNMSSMFSSCSSLKNINIDGLGGDNLTTIDNMFPYEVENVSMKNFNFGTSSVGGLFSYHSELETVDLSGAKINTNYLGNLFYGCSKLTSVNLNNATAVGLTNVYDMFSGCTLLETIDLSGFDLSNVNAAGNMFNGCSSLTTIKVSNGTNLSNVQSDYNMFNGCTSLVGGNGTTYDSSHIDKTYAIIDGTDSLPGYFTLKTN